MYNLACAESLLGNIPEAISCLEKAIDLGYSNISHMLNDSDLDNISDHMSYFVERIKTLSSTGPDRHTEIVSPPFSEPVEREITPLVERQVEREVDPLTEREVEREVTPKQPTKWAAELAILHDIGYFDDELLITYLERTKGSVEQTVLSLIDM